MKRVDVAAAVIQRPDGSFLLGQRAPDTFYAGYWEFPGGKVEAGETPREALVRELSEELGIAVDTAYPWLVREHHYEHAHVRLHFFRVVRWHGELHDHVHSALAWQTAERLTVAPMLPANAPVLKALALPAFYAISHAQRIGVAAQLAALERALAGGLKLVLVREPELAADERRRFALAALALCRRHGAHLLIARDEALAREIGADGLHLSSMQLMACRARPELPLVAASCHDAAELDRAEALGLDFAVLGPVAATTSHPGQAPIGWQNFFKLVQYRSLPIYALGGMIRKDIEAAWQAGGHGVAAIRDAWQF